MKVLFLTWEYPPHIDGGLGQHVKELTPALLDHEPALEMHVITPVFGGQAGHERLGRLHVHRVAAPVPSEGRIYDDVRAANPAFVAVAEQVIAEHGPFHLIHVHDWLPGFAALQLQEAFGLPLVATIHATERGRYRGALFGDLSRAIDGAEYRLAQHAQRVITCSGAMQREVQDFFGVPAERISVIPNGIDGSRLRSLRDEDLSDFRRIYARPDERLVFNVGRLVYEKGADLLVESAPLVLRRAPDAKYVIGGRGPLLAYLGERIDAMNLHGKVLLTGYLSDEERDRLYVVADVCVFPSRYEPFGIVALEAMAAGTPVVVADVGGLGAVVQNEQTGLTAYPEDVDSLAWTITRVLDDTEAAILRAERASSYVELCLAWPVIADMTMQAYAAVARDTGEP
jgi:glycosyltransferase involved in cell wall biosynthesis